MTVIAFYLACCIRKTLQILIEYNYLLETPTKVAANHIGLIGVIYSRLCIKIMCTCSQGNRKYKLKINVEPGTAVCTEYELISFPNGLL